MKKLIKRIHVNKINYELYNAETEINKNSDKSGKTNTATNKCGIKSNMNDKCGIKSNLYPLACGNIKTKKGKK